MRLRKVVLGRTAVDGITLRARISVQEYWPKNVQAGKQFGEDRKKLKKSFGLFLMHFRSIRL